MRAAAEAAAGVAEGARQAAAKAKKSGGGVLVEREEVAVVVGEGPLAGHVQVSRMETNAHLGLRESYYILVSGKFCTQSLLYFSLREKNRKGCFNKGSLPCFNKDILKHALVFA